MPSNSVKLDLSILNKIKKEVARDYTIKIGILGQKDKRGEGSNATIGLRHEIGVASEELPKRSFLLMPLNEKLPKQLKAIGQETFDALTTQNIEPFLKKLGIRGEVVIQEAFDTGGFGKWAPLSESTKQKKGFDKVLIETTQLRKSIISEVEK